MKDFIILTDQGGTIMSGINIREVLKTFTLMFDEEVFGIVQIDALTNLPATDYLTKHIGLS